MADPASASSSVDKTFTAFNKEQGAHYAQHRLRYHPKLYSIIIDRHKSTGGQLDTVVDVGCGPGIAVRDLAPHFTHAIGLDPSEGMISNARSLGGVTASSEPIRFEVSTAESLGAELSLLPDGSVDMITAATAAHWFDMTSFWPRAAQLLKPGGTVALWCGGNLRPDPALPNAAAIQAAFDKLDERLSDYMVPGNRLARSLYANILLPWTLPTPVPEFDQASFLRKEWNTGPGSEPGDEFHAMPQQTVTLDIMETVLGTGGPILRWREGNPDAVGTEQDVVRRMRREIEASYREVGVEEGKEVMKGGIAGVLLLVKKKE